MLGFSYDWDREVDTTDPGYVKWTQWIFLQLFKKGLAFQQSTWPSTGARSSAPSSPTKRSVDGKSERRRLPGREAAAPPVVAPHHRSTPTACSRISSGLDWPETKVKQAHWIGRSEGAERRLRRRRAPERRRSPSSRRAPTRSPGATYVRPRARARARRRRSRAPEHARRGEGVRRRRQRARATSIAATPTEEKTGVPTGAFAVNPINGEQGPGLRRRLRHRRLRHRRRHGRARRTTSATSRSPEVRPPDRRGRRRRRTATLPSTSRRRPSPTTASRARPRSRAARRRRDGHAERAGAPRRDRLARGAGRRAARRSPTSSATGSSRASATGASRSRSTSPSSATATRAQPARTSPIRYDQPIASRRASCRCSCPTSRTSSPAPTPRARSRAPSTGASSRRTASGSRARPTRCRSGRARAGTTCASSTRRTPPRAGRARPTTRGCPSTSTSAAPSTRCCTSSTRASGTRCSSTSALVKHAEPFTKLVHQGMILGTSYRYFRALEGDKRSSRHREGRCGPPIRRRSGSPRRSELVEELWAHEDETEVRGQQDVPQGARRRGRHGRGEDEQVARQRRQPRRHREEPRRRRAPPLRDVHGPARGREALADERASRACAASSIARGTSCTNVTRRRRERGDAAPRPQDHQEGHRGHRAPPLQHGDQRDDDPREAPRRAAGGRRARRRKALALLVSPFAPHIGEELWQRLGAHGARSPTSRGRRSTRRS